MGIDVGPGSLDLALRESVRSAYCQLALALPGAALRVGGFGPQQWPTICIGPNLPSFANFGLGMDTEEAARQVAGAPARFGVRGDRFWAFLCSADGFSGSAEVLHEAGFSFRYRLVGMGWTGGRPEDAPAVIRFAQGDAERREVAQFMVDQFFSSSPGAVRDAVLVATWKCEHRLASLVEDGVRIGAVMLVSGPGALPTVGLYNLCVDYRRRGEGFGRALVAAVQEEAIRAGRPVVLQCDESLVGFYESLGFARCGAVDCWTGEPPVGGFGLH